MDFKVLQSELVYKAHKFDVRRDHIQLPDGRTGDYDIVVHNGAVAMLPLDADGRIHFVRQFRPSTGKRILEIPAGTLEPGEPPEACAQRELREEIGMAPGRLTPLSDFYLAPGYSTERMYIFLAEELTPEELPADEDEFLQVEKLSLAEAFVAMQGGEIEEAKTMLALYLTRELLQKRAG
ncbi:MAG: NUDIX hydrolase [Anaerolineales bacterium]|nr:NUDIX hydrolase [Anaerolineales bacterium]